jgi:hypothetical protein
MFITTEHSTLQNARATAITQSTSRAAIFVTAVSAGMVALGLTASATHLDTAFYAFGTILLLTLAAIGFATFDWVLQSGSKTASTRNGSKRCGPAILTSSRG